MALWFANKQCDLSAVPIGSDHYQKWKEEAQKAFYKRNPAANSNGSHTQCDINSESIATREWLATSLRSNTGQDRICAMAYLINARPTECLRYLDTLISIINPAKQRDCFQAIDALYQLWVRSLLPRRRNLIPLTCRPFELLQKMDSDNVQETLSLWFFEDELKARYTRFVKALERLLMTDTVESFKRKAIGVLASLVCTSPENRSIMLSAIVNKLGDRSKVLASCVIHKLRGIAGRHPTLLDALVDEVRSFLFRPNLLERAKYYAISLLSCLQLRNENKNHAEPTHAGNTTIKLVKIYTAFFHAMVTSDEIPERLCTALLTGLSRAAPFIPHDRFTEYVKEVDDIFRLVHTTSFNVSLQALNVLFQLSSHRPEIRDRYYQALYRKLRHPDLLQTSRGPTVLHLIYRSMLNDPDPDRRAAFAQRLLQLCLVHPQPGFIVGSLILLSKVHIAKQNLIVNSQVTVQSKVNPELTLSTNAPDSITTAADDDDEEEHFSDAPDSDTEMIEPQINTSSGVTSQPVPTWEHRLLAEGGKLGPKGSGTGGSQRTVKSQSYNPEAREPLFARAGGFPSWPLVLLSKHAHPSVSLLARTLLTGEAVSYTGNPFDDFSSLHFLDRFAYKKPKSTRSKASAKTTQKQNPPTGRPFQLQVGVKTGSRALPVNSALFRQMAQDHVPADEQFFHKYFKFLEARYGKQPKKARRTEESDDSVSDEEFDAYLEKYEKGLIPSGPDVDEDDDIKFDNADFSDQSSEPEDAPNSEDEAVFSAMDGVAPPVTGKHQPTDFETNVDLDDEMDDFDEGDEDSDGQDNEEDEDDDLEDDDDDDSELTVRGSKSRKLDSVFASAEEVGELYRIQETARQRKQRLWEEKRSEDGLSRRPRKRRKQGHHGPGNRQKSSGSALTKSKKGPFKPHRNGAGDGRKKRGTRRK